MHRAAVVGYGSIGQRHARVLSELGCEVAVVSRRAVEHRRAFASTAQMVRDFDPQYVVVANETSRHAEAVAELAAARYRGRLLIEKPLAGARVEGIPGAAVGYNLRFHPVLQALKEALSGERLLSIQIYCGQYLPDWRPGTDYRRSYSASRAAGGGVLRDLSHELDYLQWLAGPWRRVAALGGRLGELDIDSDDAWALLVELERCPAATVQVNYLDRPGRRQIVLNTAGHTYAADLGRAMLVRDGAEKRFEVERDDTYRAQHKAMLAGDLTRACSIADAERVMQLVAAAERSAAEGSWVAA
jgi:predicted dehydrogenase